MRPSIPTEHPSKKRVDRQNWAVPQWHILIGDGQGQLVSHVGLVTRLCGCDGVDILLGGIGGVQTHPRERRKGYAGAGLQRAIEVLEDDMRVEMSLLFCGPQMLTVITAASASAITPATPLCGGAASASCSRAMKSWFGPR